MQKEAQLMGRYQSGLWQSDEGQFLSLHRDLVNYKGHGIGIIHGIRYVMASHWVSLGRYDLVDIQIIAQELVNYSQGRSKKELYSLLQGVLKVYNEGKGLYKDEPEVMYFVWGSFKQVVKQSDEYYEYFDGDDY